VLEQLDPAERERFVELMTDLYELVQTFERQPA
jgi:hypothetical protein